LNIDAVLINDGFLVFYGVIQILYLGTFVVELYFHTRPINWVDVSEARRIDRSEYPYIVLFYPVLRELEATMRTTFLSLERLDYPRDRYRVVAIPNADDLETVASLRRLQAEFSFLQIIEVPPTSHHTWQPVWESWESTEKAYWWHVGARAGNRDLPPKKTRQLIFAFYNIARELADLDDFLVNYIDADSCPPADHFLAAAAGIRHFDVLQAQNIAGNLNDSLAASWHAFDHMSWDGRKYPHLSANGKQPFWVLGKGLFFKASDLVELGGFHPWLTIEDPEVGMRFWTNGKRLGIIENPLIEEVPSTFSHGITQRKRWVAGFFQSLGRPLGQMGMGPWGRFKARLNFLPCLSLWLNAFGLPLGIWAAAAYFWGHAEIPDWMLLLGATNIWLFAFTMSLLYQRVWKRSALVLKRKRDRLWYMFRVNPLFILVWWLIWLIPLWIGFRMYLRDEGLIWERTEKRDANHTLVRLASRDGKPPVATPVVDQHLPHNIIPFPASEPKASRHEKRGISHV